jgi:hypothetical protein
MSYSIYIGAGKPEYDTEYCQLSAGWVVDGVSHEEAPEFPNDPMTGKGNSRHPSYCGWSDFCREAGLYDLFFDKEFGLMSSHPGCEMIQEHHVAEVKKALSRWKGSATKPPGFSGFGVFNKEKECWETPDKDKYDHILARLIWLDYWMTWALETCEVPAIQNT